MKYRILGRTGFQVSEIGYGAWGIGGNQWWDPERQKVVTSVSDPATKLVGAPGEGASPHNLRADTLGDELKLATGQTAYSGPFTVSQGTANFAWDGKGTDGTQWPAGTYKIAVTGTDSSGNNVAISTQVQGIVDSVDLTQNPPLLSIGAHSNPPFCQP